MEAVLQDLRYGARTLAKNSGFTLVAILTLALGIGANTAVFSAVSAFLLRPLPVQNAGRLMTINARFSGAGNQFSYLDYKDFKQQATGFSDVLAWHADLDGISYGGKAEQAVVSMVSSNYFSALGLRPYLGQLISGEDAERSGADPVVVLGFNYWKQRFNSDPSVLGKQVKVDGRLLTVIGVTPPDFAGLFSLVEMEAYLPLSQWDPDNRSNAWTKRDDREVAVLGYLKPGITRKQAETSAALVAARLRRQYPDLEKGLEITVVPELQSRPSPQDDNGLVVAAAFFLGLAAMVLLLACANIANLQLVRATVRQREMAIRAALGAARSRLVRQLLTESLLLALMGGAAGVITGAVIVNSVRSFRLDAGFPMRFDLSLDWRVFAYSCAAALMTGIVLGLAPALRVSKTNVVEVLHEGSRGTSAGATRSRLRNAFVVSQVAGCFVLLTVAALFVSSLENAERTYLGFDPDHVLNLSMDPHLVGLDESKGRQFYRDLEQRVRQLPGVQHVTTATMVPLGFLSDNTSIYNAEHPTDDKHAAPQVTYNDIGEDYFQVMRVPILRGRAFTSADKQDAPLVAIINQTMADTMWPEEDPIGKRFSRKSAAGPWVQVVGVAANNKWFSPAEPPHSFVFFPATQDYSSLSTLQVRSSESPATLIPEIERIVRELVPDIPIFDVQPMNQALKTGNGFLLYRMGAEFTLAIGLLGLTLALVGVYGVLSYVTAQRTREIGIRLALGAERLDILRMIVRQGFWVTAIGIAIGAAISVGGARLFRSLLVGAHSAQPWMPLVVGIFLMSAALLASYIPARRATQVDPVVALKYE